MRRNMSVITFIHHPIKLAETTKLLQNSPNREVLAGGTHLGVHVPGRVTEFVDLTRVGLNYIRKEGNGCRIGAMATIAGVARSVATGPLVAVAGTIATEPLRHMITAGGNVMQPLRWSDLPVLLSVLDAEFIVKGNRTRRLTADRFFAKQPKQILKPGELLIEIVVPDVKKTVLSRKKIVRAHDDIPALHIAVACGIFRGRLKNVRIAYVGQNALPVRLKKTESIVEDQKPSAALFRAAGRNAAEEIQEVKDIRFGTEYIREMAGVYCRRLLQECAKKAKRK